MPVKLDALPYRDLKATIQCSMLIDSIAVSNGNYSTATKVIGRLFSS